MSLASLLLQRYYIKQSTGEKWDSIEIQHTPQNKPYFRDLQYNMSHTDGIVVLGGFEYPVGIDIVRRDLTTVELSVSDLASIFSSYERKSLSECPNVWEFNDLYLMTWAFKEAYMKSTGVPDWDRLASIEFHDIHIPLTNDSCITNCVSKVFVHGYQQSAYTESHMLENVYFVAIYTSISPEKENNGFTWITLEDIVTSLIAKK
jgi:phosphopantetheinyl transferase